VGIKEANLSSLEEFSPGQYLSMCPCEDGRMKRRRQFLEPVRTLAPGDNFVFNSPSNLGSGSAAGTTYETAVEPPLSLSHALRVQAARYWLELGEADEALRELEALPSQAWQHPLVVAVRIGALEVGGECS
jgi:hypothetical protein